MVRLIFHHSTEDRWSCQRIADELNSLGIPLSYTRASRSVTRGKRTTQTAGIWRAGRVRNMLVSTTYKGIHTYGKRSDREREVIERPVPALVTEETWDQAQRTLKRNAWVSPRNSKRDYLLRGLIRCGTCGLSYSGSSWTTKAGEVQRYYTCNGRAQHRGIHGAQGEKCPAQAVSGRLEAEIWEDIVTFAIDAADVIAELRQESAKASRRKRCGKKRRVASDSLPGLPPSGTAFLRSTAGAESTKPPLTDSWRPLRQSARTSRRVSNNSTIDSRATRHEKRTSTEQASSCTGWYAALTARTCRWTLPPSGSWSRRWWTESTSRPSSRTASTSKLPG